MAALLAGAVGCENANLAELKKAVADADKECPMNMGMTGDMLSIKYSDEANEVQFYYSLNEDEGGFEVSSKTKNILRQLLKLGFSKGESRDLLKQMAEAGVGVGVTYKGASSGKAIKLSFSPEEVRQMSDSPMTDEEINRLSLTLQVEIENSRCPYQIEEGMEITRVYDDGDRVVYNCSMDEDMYSIPALRASLSEVKPNIKETFDDPVVKHLTGMIKALGKSLVYHYYGDTTGESVDIVFTPDEL